MGQIRSLTVTLETVTPMFLGGANSNGPPELRAPSIRGVLRYWLRAILGGVIGDSNLMALWAMEEAVFGSTERGSPTVVQLREVEGSPLSVRSEYILPHKQTGRRKAYSEGQPLVLCLRQLRNNDETLWNLACATVALATTFGGIGLRARRGYGTLRVRAAEPALVPTTPSTLDGWKKHIDTVASHAIACAGALASIRSLAVVGLPAGPAAYPCATRKGMIRITELKPPVQSAMGAIVAFMDRVPKTQALGGIDPRRQSSPLWVRPIQIDQQYGLLFAVLASQFQGADYGMVRRVLDQFPGQDVTVKGWNQ